MEAAKEPKLIFIYNANSGIRNAILDGAHKILSPATYNCNLCDITFGAFTENKVWKNFRESSGLPMEFLHKDEFNEQYPTEEEESFGFPVILTGNATELNILVPTHELNTLKDAGELINLLKERLV